MQPYSILNSRAVFTQRHLAQLRKRDAVYIGINNAAQPFPEPKCIALVSARALGRVIGKAGDWSQITFYCAQDIAGCDLTGRAGQFVPPWLPRTLATKPARDNGVTICSRYFWLMPWLSLIAFNGRRSSSE